MYFSLDTNKSPFMNNLGGFFLIFLYSIRTYKLCRVMIVRLKMRRELFFPAVSEKMLPLHNKKSMIT